MNIMDLCESLLEVVDADQVVATLERATGALSCSTFGGFYRIENGDQAQPLLVESFTNVPTEFAGYSSIDAMGCDPVMQTVKRSNMPMVWNQDTYVAANRGEMWEELASWGLASGIIVATHLPGGKHFCLGFDTPERLHPSDRESGSLLANLLLIAAHAQAAAEKVLAIDQLAASVNPLSARERESLTWAAAGKTAWETGVILSITESTVNKHVDSAIKKLQCANKTHAVARAMREGWLY